MIKKLKIRMDFTIARKNMVEEQIKKRGIKNPHVIKAFLNVPRHKFVSSAFQSQAYENHPLPIGNGQTISQPYMVALMTTLLEIKSTDKVLEIGTGSGYQSAILAELCEKVFSIERIKNLAISARRILDELKYFNINIKVGDGTYGWQEFAPFDKIIVTAGAPHIPPLLIEQLQDAGKMVIPLALKNTSSQNLKLIEKKNNKIFTKEICECVFVPLIGKYGWEE